MFKKNIVILLSVMLLIFSNICICYGKEKINNNDINLSQIKKQILNITERPDVFFNHISQLAEELHLDKDMDLRTNTCFPTIITKPVNFVYSGDDIENNCQIYTCHLNTKKLQMILSYSNNNIYKIQYEYPRSDKEVEKLAYRHSVGYFAELSGSVNKYADISLRAEQLLHDKHGYLRVKKKDKYYIYTVDSDLVDPSIAIITITAERF